MNRRTLRALVLALTTSLAGPAQAQLPQPTLQTRTLTTTTLAQAPIRIVRKPASLQRPAATITHRVMSKSTLSGVLSGGLKLDTGALAGRLPSGPPTRRALVVILENGGVMNNVDPALRQALNVNINTVTCGNWEFQLRSGETIGDLVTRIASQLAGNITCLNPANWRQQTFNPYSWLSDMSDQAIEDAVKSGSSLLNTQSRYDTVAVMEDADAVPDPAPCGDELGAAPEAGVWHRDRHLRALRRAAQDHRQHRRARGHCQDPRARRRSRIRRRCRSGRGRRRVGPRGSEFEEEGRRCGPLRTRAWVVAGRGSGPGPEGGLNKQKLRRQRMRTCTRRRWKDPIVALLGLSGLLGTMMIGAAGPAFAADVTTIAGSGTGGYSSDGGPTIAARLSSPGGIAVAADGTIYFADKDNYRVRRIGTDGIVTTIAGTGVLGKRSNKPC